MFSVMPPGTVRIPSAPSAAAHSSCFRIISLPDSRTDLLSEPNFPPDNEVEIPATLRLYSSTRLFISLKVSFAVLIVSEWLE
jgi:hypothetical protein